MSEAPLNALSLQHLSPATSGRGSMISIPQRAEISHDEMTSSVHAQNHTLNVADTVVIKQPDTAVTNQSEYRTAYNKELGASIFQTLNSEGAVILQFPSKGTIEMSQAQRLDVEQRGQELQSEKNMWIC